MKMKDMKKHSKCSTSLPEPTNRLHNSVTNSSVIVYKILCLCLSEDFCTVTQANGNSTRHSEETKILFNRSKYNVINDQAEQGVAIFKGINSSLTDNAEQK